MGPALLGLSSLQAALLGAVLAAVSPAVVVPRMVKMMEEGYGSKEGIPQLILAGASVDDIYVIVLFTTFLGMSLGEGVSVVKFVNIPISIILGIGIGLLVGWALSELFKAVHMRDTSKILITLSVSFLLVVGEDSLNTPITYSALIAIMFIGVSLQKFRKEVAKRMSVKNNKLWVGAEVFLFVLVGVTVDITYVGSIGVKAVILIVCALLFRMLGVFVCLIKTDLKAQERLFAMLAYTPKATVAVLAILLTAPLGAFAIDATYKKWTKKGIKYLYDFSRGFYRKCSDKSSIFEYILYCIC